MAEKLEFDLTVKNNQLDKTLDSSAKKAVTLEGALETALGVLGGGLALKAFDGLISGFDSLISTGKEAIDAAAAQEVATNNLNNALARQGNYTKEASEDLLAFASALQKTTVYEDDAVIASSALLQSLTNLNTQGLKAGVGAAADFATVLGIDLEAATRLVAKAAEGNVEAFKRYGVEIKKGSSDTETFANTIEALNKQFGGASAAQLNTYAGSFKAMGNAYADLLEPVGDIIVKNPLVIALFNEIKNSINAANTEVTGMVPQLQSLVKDGLIVAAVATQQLLDAFDFLTVATKGLLNAFQVIGGGIAQAIVEPIKLVIDGLLFLGEKVPGVGDSFKGLTNPLTEASDALNKFTMDGIEGFKKAADTNIFRDASSGIEDFATRTLDASAVVEQAALKAIKNNDDRRSNEDEVNADIIKSRTDAGNALLLAQQQLANQENEARLAQEAANLEIQGINDATALQRIYDQKIAEAEVVYQGELLKNKTITDNQAKLSANLAAADNLEKARIKASSDFKIAEAKRVAAEEKQVQAARITATSSFLALGEALAKDGSVVAKGLASANAVVQTYAGATQVLGDPLIPVLAKPALVAATIANGLANVARINGVKFADGGFIPGGGGATTGADTVTAQVRPGEMVLNANQQRQLFDAISNGNLGGGGGNIQVIIDGREVAIAVRNQLEQGFRLAV